MIFLFFPHFFLVIILFFYLFSVAGMEIHKFSTWDVRYMVCFSPSSTVHCISLSQQYCKLLAVVAQSKLWPESRQNADMPTMYQNSHCATSPRKQERNKNAYGTCSFVVFLLRNLLLRHQRKPLRHSYRKTIRIPDKSAYHAHMHRWCTCAVQPAANLSEPPICVRMYRSIRQVCGQV